MKFQLIDFLLCFCFFHFPFQSQEKYLSLNEIEKPHHGMLIEYYDKSYDQHSLYARNGFRLFFCLGLQVENTFNVI